MKIKIQKKILQWILPVGCVAVLTVAGVFFLKAPESQNELELEANATMGVLPGIDMAERQRQLQEELDDSMIAFSVNTSPLFETGKSEGNLMLENPANNAKLLVAEIYADGTDELLYRSKAIQPGSYIEKARLDKVLDKGQYPATVYFKAYREDDQSYIGQSGAAITITVAN